MKILSINDKYGDPVQFDSVEELAQAIIDSGYSLPPDGLKEKRDYLVVD